MRSRIVLCCLPISLLIIFLLGRNIVLILPFTGKNGLFLFSKNLSIGVSDFQSLAARINATRNHNSSAGDNFLPDYFLIIPPIKLLTTAEIRRFGSPLSLAANTALAALVKELEQNAALSAVAGLSTVFPDPACRLTRSGPTLRVSKFSQGKPLTISTLAFKRCSCYYCDVLPDTFVARSTSLQQFFMENPYVYDHIGEAVHLRYFLSMQNQSVYCPCVNMTEHGLASSQDYTCNKLGTRWDQKFVNFPNATGILRMINIEQKEAWFLCVWSQSSITAKLPIACANFLYRYLVDIVDIIEKKYNVDYRIVFGTLLGALRDQDIIPWTADVDVGVNLQTNKSVEQFDMAWTNTLARSSNWLYDPLSMFESMHYSIRAFPRCPVLVDSGNRTVSLATVDQLVERELEQRIKEVFTNFMTIVGYVDVYPPEQISHEYYNRKHNTFMKPDIITIRHRSFKGGHNATEALELCYGARVVEDKPYGFDRNFTGVIDSQRSCDYARYAVLDR